MSDPLLELVDVSKHYPGVVALDRVALSLQPGEVLGLVGENGAGKSTLMKVLGGLVKPTSGIIRIDGIDRHDFSVRDSLAAGVAFVHQELNLFDNLDVAANVLIGREPLRAGPFRLIDEKKLHMIVQPLLERIGAEFRADAPISGLSLAQRQLVEIAKSLSLDARVVIMDEPTSSLTMSETDRLLRVITDLKEQGVSVIFISHHLNEVERCADRVVVLRDGQVAGMLQRDEITHDAMIRLMVGRDLKFRYSPPAAPAGDIALELVQARTETYPDQAVDLTLHYGEILGLAGLVGSGRTELARTMFGIDRLVGGAIRLDGEPVTATTPRAAIDRGLYLVPEDRRLSGLVLELPIVENISLPNLKAYARATLVHRGRENENAERQKTRLRIKAPTVRTHAASLSGGNQQKVVLAKWLSIEPRVMIFDEPTRGIDVGAKGEIHDIMRTLSDDGVAVLMISSDMEEVIGVSDRIAVMHEGRISGILNRPQFSEQNVLRLAVGLPLN
ncbi:MAG: sugar ABC transporter ATP-binding protein [Bradyrhizobium sp.]|nr:sugar ABC transporter ATP-binding protein [Bradyrhizobium sp.]